MATPDEPEAIALALITACHAKEYAVMAQIMCELSLQNVSATMAAMGGLASTMLDYLCEYMEIEPAVLLHRLGIATAQA